MNRMFVFFYVSGLMFWSSFFIYETGMLLVLNGLGNHFEFRCENASVLYSDWETSDIVEINYSYSVSGKDYVSGEIYSIELLEGKINNADTILNICYNSSFPQFSFLQSVGPPHGKHKFGVIISLLFISLLSVLFFLNDRKYWLKKYRIFMSRLN